MCRLFDEREPPVLRAGRERSGAPPEKANPALIVSLSAFSAWSCPDSAGRKRTVPLAPDVLRFSPTPTIPGPVALPLLEILLQTPSIIHLVDTKRLIIRHRRVRRPTSLTPKFQSQTPPPLFTSSDPPTPMARLATPATEKPGGWKLRSRLCLFPGFWTHPARLFYNHGRSWARQISRPRGRPSARQRSRPPQSSLHFSNNLLLG